MPTIHSLLNTFYPQTPEDAEYSISQRQTPKNKTERLYLRCNKSQMRKMPYTTPRRTIRRLIERINSQISFAQVASLTVTKDSLGLSIASDTVTLSFSEEEIQQETVLWKECVDAPDIGEVQTMSLLHQRQNNKTTVDQLEIQCSSLSELQELRDGVNEARQTQKNRLRIDGSDDSIYSQFTEHSLLFDKLDLFSQTSLSQLTHTKTKVLLYVKEDGIRLSLEDRYKLEETNNFNI